MSMRSIICQRVHPMGVSMFLCLPRVRSVAPSRAFRQARLDYLVSLCHVFCRLAYASGLLYPSRNKCAGDGLHTHVTSSICSCGQKLWRGSGLF